MEKILFLTFFCLSSSLWASIEPPKENVQSLGERSEKADWKSAISHSVVIDRSIEDVWAYVGNSLNAENWSIYFSHITPKVLVTDTTQHASILTTKQEATGENQVDGDIGALRRCFRDREEKTLSWDEQVIAIKPLQERYIYTYALVGFWPTSWTSESAFFVKQTYEKIDINHTRLSFASVVDNKKSVLARLVFRIGREDALDIITKNLENIKARLEGKPRLHAYQPFPRKWNEAFFSNVTAKQK